MSLDTNEVQRQRAENPLHYLREMVLARNLLYFILILALSLLCQLATAQNNTLSSSAQVSLLTCSAGDDAYTSWGHTAIRIHDPERAYDKVFNYGTFDFDTPNFMLKFLRGKLLYKLGIASTKKFRFVYEREKRTVWEQVLNLDAAEEQEIFDYLLNEYKPENRFYQYDFFFDNCATRVRDVFEKTMEDRLEWAENPAVKDRTLRGLLDEGIIENAPLDFGIDLILGANSDVKADTRNAMFLPFHLQSSLKDAKIRRGGKWEPFVVSESSFFEFDRPIHSKFNWTIVIALAVILLIRLFFLKSNSKGVRIFDYSLFFLAGLIGVILAFMWLGTDHKACGWNLHLFWANPLYLLMLIGLRIKGLRPYMKYLFIFTAHLTFMGFFLIPGMGQYLHPAIVILMLILLLASVRRVFVLWKS